MASRAKDIGTRPCLAIAGHPELNAGSSERGKKLLNDVIGAAKGYCTS
jgi:hypothetical protein